MKTCIHTSNPFLTILRQADQCYPALLIGIALLLPLSPSSAQVFFDGVLSNADWSASIVSDTSTPPSTFSAGQVPTGGNGVHPDPYREVTHTYQAGLIHVGHLRNSFSWNPSSQGAIASLDYSYDLIFPNGPFDGAVAYRLFLSQAGVDYVSNVGIDATFMGNPWTSFGHSGLDETDFVELLGDGTLVGGSNPDFSTGGSITFGYDSANSHLGDQQIMKTSGLDNYNVELHIVPEPTSLACLLWGVAILGLRRARSTKA